MKVSAKKKLKIKKAIKELESLSEEELKHRCTHCPKCDKKIVPDKKAVTFGTKKWDGHTYKFPCNCSDMNLRFCIG